jgi:hypothetical protein
VLSGTGPGSGANPIGQSIPAVVTDLCPECASGSVDLGWQGDGRWDISWKAVNCPTTSGFQYLFQGSNPWYIKLQARNTKIPVRLIEILVGTNIYAGTRTPDNFFTFQGPNLYPFSFPLSVRITGINDEALIDEITSANLAEEKVVINGANNVQFIGFSTATTTPQTTEPATTTPQTTVPETTAPQPIADSCSPIFRNDVIDSRFASWSWGTFSLTDSTMSNSGTKSISLTKSDYDAIYLRCDRCISSSVYAGVSFYVNTIGPTPVTFRTQFRNANDNLVGDFQEFTATPNTWTKYSALFNSFAPGIQTFNSIQFQDDGSSPLRVLYFDSISLICNN